MCGGVLEACRAMIITIATTGGIGGFGLGPARTVDVDRLAPDIRRETCAVMTDARLAPLTAKAAEGADRITYAISISVDGATRRYEIAESALPPDMLDLIDSLSAAE